MTTTDQTTAELLARLERLEAERARSEQLQAMRQDPLGLFREPPPAKGWKGEVQRAQTLALQARRRAVEERDRAYAAAMERLAPQREQLRGKLADIATKQAEENARHAKEVSRHQAVLADLNSKADGLRAELEEIERLPEPVPDYSEANRVHRDAMLPADAVLAGAGSPDGWKRAA